MYKLLFTLNLSNPKAPIRLKKKEEEGIIIK